MIPLIDLNKNQTIVGYVEFSRKPLEHNDIIMIEDKPYKLVNRIYVIDHDKELNLVAYHVKLDLNFMKYLLQGLMKVLTGK